MSLIDEQTRDQLRQIFSDLDRPVRLQLFTRSVSPLAVSGEQPCTSCGEAQQLLTEVADLSDKLELEVHDIRLEPEGAQEAGIDRVPALVLRSEHSKGAVRFFGLTAGYEFSTVVGDIVDLSQNNVLISESTIAELTAIQDPVHIQVFVTPT